MTDLSEEQLFSLWAAALAPRPLPAGGRERLMAAIQAEPQLPFCRELAEAFALPFAEMRSLLARLVDAKAWTRGIAPFEAFIDFTPGPSLAPLRAGFIRLGSQARLPPHRHTDRELTYVLSGEMVDDTGRRYGPGESIDMAVGSVHSLGVPEGKRALVALLHGRIEFIPS